MHDQVREGDHEHADRGVLVQAEFRQPEPRGNPTGHERDDQQRDQHQVDDEVHSASRHGRTGKTQSMCRKGTAQPTDFVTGQ